MKKRAILLVIILISNTQNAFQGSQLIQQEIGEEHSTLSFLDVAEKQDNKRYLEDSDVIDEYDQNVCDDVSPAAISPLQVSLTNIMGKIFVNCLIMKEMASNYFTEFKTLINKWLSMVIKS